MNKLEKICQYKIDEIKKLKKENDFKKKFKKKKIRKFLLNLKKKSKESFNLIAEIKKSSPSKGLICKDFDPIEIAKKYEKAGARCLSILTEKKFFHGDINFLREVKKEVKLPILRKDFILDEWQIYESHFYGADCILLILAILDDKRMSKFYKLAKKIGLDVICEIHNIKELNRAINLKVDCIGINNRNLQTLQIDINNFKKLSNKVPKNIIKICESGLNNNHQLKEFSNYGADAFLIGEFLMKSNNIYNTTVDLIKK